MPDVNKREAYLTAFQAAPIHAAEFAGWMAALEPFEPAPRLAVAVSGGADSMALAVLADRWARAAGGSVLALIVDHGLRAEAAAEAAATADRLEALGIQSRVLPLTGLSRGPGLANRARLARYQALALACASAGIVHLLLGHHLADQVETLLIRELGGSAASGMAAMAKLVETNHARLLRPLLTVPPCRLRAHLLAAGIGWVEDPSNRDIRALRPRLRSLRADRNGTGSASHALAAATAAHGAARAGREARRAASLAHTVTLRPEGFAILPPGPIAPDGFAALVQAISGARYPAETAQVEALAVAPRPATLAGIRLIESRRIAGDGWLMLREEAAIGPDMPALPGCIWDGRFRLCRLEYAPCDDDPPLVLRRLGDAAAGFRRRSGLPSAVLRGLPALWAGENLLAVPHLGYHVERKSADIVLVFAPFRPVAPAAFIA